MIGFLRAGGLAAAMMTLAFGASPAAAADAGPAVTTAATGSLVQAGAATSMTAAATLASPADKATGTAPVLWAQLPTVTAEPGLGIATPLATLARAPAPALNKPAVPLHDLVLGYVDRGDQDEQMLCLASAVYFEARGESEEGQLAVAQVVLNRAASGVYPGQVCAVVKQPAQFSFVRQGKLPQADKASDCWHRALAIADIATKNLAGELDRSILWYHATYVSPSWGRKLTKAVKIGAHIFYS